MSCSWSPCAGTACRASTDCHRLPSLAGAGSESPTDDADGDDGEDDPDGAEAEELEARAQPDGIGSDGQGEDAGQTPALIGEHREEEPRDRQPDRQEDQQQNDPDGDGGWGRAGECRAPASVIDGGVFADGAVEQEGWPFGLAGRSPGSLQGPGHDRVVVGARKRSGALVDRDARVVVVDERLVGLAVVDGDVADGGRALELARRPGIRGRRLSSWEKYRPWTG